ncbi:MAG TPA: hypothetical protein VMW18_09075 [Candidatus Binatia bacterium]|nr:hypothetical protein [Candidatus Binatia bacterium]
MGAKPTAKRKEECRAEAERQTRLHGSVGTAHQQAALGGKNQTGKREKGSVKTKEGEPDHRRLDEAVPRLCGHADRARLCRL